MSVLAALLNEATPEELDALAEALRSRLAPEPPEPDRWLNTEQAADYLACKPGRIHDLVQLRRLKPRRDGRRLLFRAKDLDACLEGSE